MAAEAAHPPKPPTVALVSNGFQSEYEAGCANGVALNGVPTVLICGDIVLRERLHPAVQLRNLRGSTDPRRGFVDKAVNMMRYWLALALFLLRRRPAVLHLIGMFTMSRPVFTFMESGALRLLSRRFVMTVHNLLPHDAHHAFNRLMYRLIYRMPHLLVVHTPRMRDQLQSRFGVAADRIVVMEHGIDRIVPPSQGDTSWLRRRCDLPPATPVVLFFGNVARYKGIDLLVEAMSLLPPDSNAVLVVAGCCKDERLRPGLRALMQPLADARRAFWFDGFVAEDEVLHFFHGADLLAMPYRHIDQSGVVFMAMATGLPVVATDVGSLAHYAPLTGGRAVLPGDPQALADAIQSQLLANRDIDREAVAARARRFMWSETVRPVLAAYVHAA